MKRVLFAAILCLFLGSGLLAQQGPADAPASREDVERYLQAMHSHEMMHKVADAMAKPLHKMLHDEFLKDKDKLPPDFEPRMTKEMDQMFAQMPWDEMLDAMVPVYQKYLTKGDVDALIAFYSSPTGQKMLREMPAIMADAMDSLMPIMRRQMDQMNQHLHEQIAEMLKEGQKAPAQPHPVIEN
jgi:uncharacterized protein